MKLLALETATTAGAVALSVDGHLVGELVTTTHREHAETLLPGAAALLAEAGLSPAELDAVVVDLGPGLYTGLRVGVSTARSLAMAAGGSDNRVVRFMKSSTDKPDEKRAVREVGSTWLGPAI